jgi:hypothetical protein
MMIRAFVEGELGHFLAAQAKAVERDAGKAMRITTGAIRKKIAADIRRAGFRAGGGATLAKAVRSRARGRGADIEGTGLQQGDLRQRRAPAGQDGCRLLRRPGGCLLWRRAGRPRRIWYVRSRAEIAAQEDALLLRQIGELRPKRVTEQPAFAAVPAGDQLHLNLHDALDHRFELRAGNAPLRLLARVSIEGALRFCADRGDAPIEGGLRLAIFPERRCFRASGRPAAPGARPTICLDHFRDLAERHRAAVGAQHDGAVADLRIHAADQRSVGHFDLHLRIFMAERMPSQHVWTNNGNRAR